MKKNIVIIVLSAVALLLAGTVGYLIAKSDTNEKDHNVNNGEIVETKEYDLEKAEELLEYFGFNDYINSKNIYSYNYNDVFKKIQALEKVDSSKIKMVNCSEIYDVEYEYSESHYKGKYGVCKKDSQVETISYELVNEMYKKMYGTDMEKEGLSTIETFGGIYYKFYDYNETLNSFVKLEVVGLGGAIGPQYLINQIKSAKIIGNELVIEVNYLAGFPLYNSYTGKYTYMLETSKVSKSLGISDTSNENDMESFENEVINNYLDMLDVYEVVFEKRGDNYIFKKLSKKLS